MTVGTIFDEFLNSMNIVHIYYSITKKKNHFL